MIKLLQACGIPDLISFVQEHSWTEQKQSKAQY